jgi:hypothetical protein
MGHRAGLDAVANRKKKTFPCRELNAGSPARSLVPELTQLPRLILKKKINIYSVEHTFYCYII